MEDFVKIYNSKPDVISSFLGFRGQVKFKKCIESVVFAGAISTSVITIMAFPSRMNVVRWLTWLGGGARANVGGGASTAS